MKIINMIPAGLGIIMLCFCFLFAGALIEACRTPTQIQLIESCKEASGKSLFILMQDDFVNADPSITKILNDCMGVWVEENGK